MNLTLDLIFELIRCQRKAFRRANWNIYDEKCQKWSEDVSFRRCKSPFAGAVESLHCNFRPIFSFAPPNVDDVAIDEQHRVENWLQGILETEGKGGRVPFSVWNRHFPTRLIQSISADLAFDLIEFEWTWPQSKEKANTVRIPFKITITSNRN